MNRLFKKIALPFAAVAGLALTPVANAAPSCLYYGIDLGSGQVNNNHSTAANMKDATFALGCKMHDLFSAEARISRDSKDWGHVLGDAELTRGALLARLEYTADRVLAYVNAGVGYAQTDIKDQKSENKTGLLWGVGLELFGSPDLAIYLGYNSQPLPEYQINGKKESPRYDVISGGFRYYFKDLF